MSEPAPDAAPAATPSEPKVASTADLDKYKVRTFLDRVEKKFKNSESILALIQTAADIVNNTIKQLISLAVDGAKVLDLCLEGDKLIEQGTGAVYNKSVKGVKVSKGYFIS